MSQEIEIEFKNMLTLDEFKQLKKELNLTRFITQYNDYFDTDNGDLRAIHTALRVREKEDKLVLTLKEPNDIGKLETHQPLTRVELDVFKRKRELPEGDVTRRLNSLKIDLVKLTHIGRLTTHRCETPLENGLFVLDKSEYLGTVDYELEWEFEDFTYGEACFHRLLNRYQIPRRPPQNKIMRFFLLKQMKESENDGQFN